VSIFSSVITNFMVFLNMGKCGRPCHLADCSRVTGNSDVTPLGKGYRRSLPVRVPALSPALSHAGYASRESIPNLGLQHLTENTERVASDNLG
jgi:hypothetical protein